MGGGKEVQDGGDIRIPMTNSCRCMAEANTTSGLCTIVKKLPSIKKKKKDRVISKISFWPKYSGLVSNFQT